MRTIRVSIERSRTRKRVWLKAVDNHGHAEIVQNIPADFAVDARNKLLDKLTASGLYDEVIGEPMEEKK